MMVLQGLLRTIAAGVLLAALAFEAGFSSLRYEQWIVRVLVLAVAGGIAVAAAVFLRPAGETGRRWLAVVLVLGIAFRVGTMFSDKMVCTDAVRYVWDGKVIASGVNPYAYPPDALELDHLRVGKLDHMVSASGVRTPYPPLAELLFFASYLLTPGRLAGFKAINLLMEVGAWSLLLGLLGRLGLPRARILLIAWAPLLVIEGYLPGHSDVLALPLVCLLIGSVIERKPVTAGLFLAAALLIKPMALFFVPAAARELGARRTAILVAVCCAVLAVVYAPLAMEGHFHFAPMALMAAKWSFNGTIVRLMAAVVPGAPVRIIAVVAMTILVVAGTALGKDFVCRCMLSLTAVFALSPVVFPWYVVWIVPLLVLRPDPAILALAILVPVTNVAAIRLLHGSHQAPLWATLVAFVPFYALIVAGALKGWGMFDSSLVSRWARHYLPAGSSGKETPE